MLRLSILSGFTDNVVEAINYIRINDALGNNYTMSAYRGKLTGIEIICSLRRFCNSFVGFPLDAEDSTMKMGGALDPTLPIPRLSRDAVRNICFLTKA